MVEKRRRKEKKRTLKQKVWEKKEECKRVNVCGVCTIKCGDKCTSNSSAELLKVKSIKYIRLDIL